MLEFIRKRATGWVAWGIVILISIPFALWGINEYFTPVSSVSVAKVNGVEIELREFQQAVQEQRARLRQMLGPEFADALDDQLVRQQTLDQMIGEQLLLEAAVRSGMRIGDAQLAATIQGLEMFRSEDGFSSELYQNFLRQQGYSPEGFEEFMRQNLLSAQISTGLSDSAFATDTDVERMRALRGQQRSVRTLKVPVSRFADVTVSDEAIGAHYEDNKAAYAKPEQVVIEYLEISRPAIAAAIPVDDAELERIYEARKANYVTPEQRKVSHILLDLAADAEPSQVEPTRQKLMDIRRQIEAGASFEEMAREHSGDPGTAQNGGDLGFIAKGVMDPAFESAAFALEKEQLSEPVRSAFGLHLIKVTEIRPSRVREFEQVKAQLKSEYQNEQADLVFSEQVERLANLVFEHPESLEIAAETLDLKPRMSEPFGRRGAESGIAANPVVVAAAYSEDVLEAGNNSEILELGDGVVVALRVARHEPSAPRTLEEVRDQIAEDLKQTAAREKAEETGRALLERLKGGETAVQVAASAGLEWSDQRTLSREDRGEDPGLHALVFRMPKPDGGAASFSGRPLADGGFEVVALESLTPGTAVEDAPSPQELRRTLSAAFGSSALAEYSRALRSSAEIAINEENLQGEL